MSTVTPTSVEDLTPSWLTSALGAEITAVEALDAHSGTTGRALLRLTSADASIPETIFAKLQPFDEEQQAFLKMVGLGASEAQLYAAAGNDLPVRVPRSYYAASDASEGSFIMLLEDLTASGCRFCSAEDDDVLSVATSLMDELALLHSTYWGQDLTWLGTHAMTPKDGPEAAQGRAMGAMIVQSALDQFTETMPPEFKALGDLYVGRHGDIAALFGEGDRTLIHGDTHIGNLFVDGDRTGLYDWAAAMRLPGMRDVAYFLCNSLPTEVRRSKEQSLLTRYRAGLAAAGVELDQATIDAQYRIFAVSSWIAATTTAAMGSKWQPIEVALKATERTTQAVADLDVLGYLHERIG